MGEIPVIIRFNKIFHYKPSIFGYPHPWKPHLQIYQTRLKNPTSLRLAGSGRRDYPHVCKRPRFKKHLFCFRKQDVLLKSTTEAADPNFMWRNQVALESRICFEKGLHLLLVTCFKMEQAPPEDIHHKKNQRSTATSTKRIGFNIKNSLLTSIGFIRKFSPQI